MLIHIAAVITPLALSDTRSSVIKASMGTFAVSDEQISRYHRDGFFVVEGLFDQEEMDLLRDIARRDYGLENAAASRRDGQGGAIRLAVHNELGNDIYSAFVRSRR